MSQKSGPQEAEASHPPSDPTAAETASGTPDTEPQESLPSNSVEKETGNGEKTSKKESQENKNQERATVSSPRASSPAPEPTSTKSNAKDSHSSHSHQSSLENFDDEPVKPAKKSAFDLLDYVTYWERVQMGLARGTEAIS